MDQAGSATAISGDGQGRLGVGDPARSRPGEDGPLPVGDLGDDGRGHGLTLRGVLVLVLLGIAAILAFGALRTRALEFNIIHGELGIPLPFFPITLSRHTLAGFWAVAVKLLTVVGILGLRDPRTRDWRSGVALGLGLSLDLIFQTWGYGPVDDLEAWVRRGAAAVPVLALAMAIWLFEVPALGRQTKRRAQDRALDQGAASEVGHALESAASSGVETGQPASGPASPPPPPSAGAENLPHTLGTVTDPQVTAPSQPVVLPAGQASRADREKARRAYRANKPLDQVAAETGIDREQLVSWWPTFERLYGAQNGRVPEQV